MYTKEMQQSEEKYFAEFGVDEHSFDACYWGAGRGYY